MVCRPIYRAPAPPGEWIDRAACHGSDVEMVPEQGDRAGIEAARAVCRRCPVGHQCLAYVMAFPEPVEGVWAGTTKKQRGNARSGHVPWQRTG
jgi:WhiB family transcriptional regulator, redox-sensing transcriptional regulator